jgi:hypothetical protein
MINGFQMSRYGAISRALPATLGKIFFVVHGDDAFAGNLLNEFPVDSDGVPRVYVTTTESALTADLAIQAALDACVASRNDYVIILPSNYNYKLGAALTMSKRDVHLIGLDYLFNKHDTGANSATKVQQTADADIITLSGGNCEIAGFYFKNYNNQGSVYITGAVCDCAHVHHNHFNMNATTTYGVAQVDASTASSSFLLIERNTFATNVSNLTFASLIDISSSCTWAKVLRNAFMIGDGCTMTIVINNLSYKGATNDNDIMCANGGGGATSTITNAITIGGGVAMGNRMTIAGTTTQDLVGGGSLSFVDNRDAITGGSLAFTN